MKKINRYKDYQEESFVEKFEKKHESLLCSLFIIMIMAIFFLFYIALDTSYRPSLEEKIKNGHTFERSLTSNGKNRGITN